MSVATTTPAGGDKPPALALLSAHRPRDVGWWHAAGLLFGDWGTSRLYVLGLAFFFASRSSFWLILAMSGLVLAVGWAYTQICRIYPDGGGVYTAARQRSKMLAVFGALLLFADYTVTASISALDAFHYFGLPLAKHAEVAAAHDAIHDAAPVASGDAGQALRIGGGGGGGGNQSAEKPAAEPPAEPAPPERLLAVDSPGLWAIVAVLGIGAFNLLGPRHTGKFALFAAGGMVAMTLLIAAAATGQLDWSSLPQRIGTLRHPPGEMWLAFVSIVLALSGVEAIANLTGVMKQPVARTARRAIWLVTGEVAVFNLVLAVAMLNVFPLGYDAHKEDMLAFLGRVYAGPWGEWLVRAIGGTLLLSATNTAVTDMIAVQYLMGRDGEMPASFQRLNRFGVPWLPAILAAGVPAAVLVVSHDLEHLAALYAIGVIGAVAINVTLCAAHPRLYRLRRRTPMTLLAAVLLAIWVTLALTKLHALAFVTTVVGAGLALRALTRWAQRRRAAGRPRTSLLLQAVREQLPPDLASGRRLLLGTYGSTALADAALRAARDAGAALVVCFVREVDLGRTHGPSAERLTLDTDAAAVRTFGRFLERAHALGVPLIPVYDTGPDAAELIAEHAALCGVERVLIGTSRRGPFHRLVKGRFRQRLESVLPQGIGLEVLTEWAEGAGAR